MKHCLEKCLAALGLGLVAILALLPVPAAADVKGSGISVSDVWARASAGRARAGAAYLMVTNSGSAADRLVAVRTPIAKKAELHQHTMSGGVMRMRHVAKGIGLKAGGKIIFRPGGYHVMLMGLKAPLKAGDHFPLTLLFERAGSIDTTVTVRPIR